MCGHCRPATLQLETAEIKFHQPAHAHAIVSRSSYLLSSEELQNFTVLAYDRWGASQSYGWFTVTNWLQKDSQEYVYPQIVNLALPLYLSSNHVSPYTALPRYDRRLYWSSYNLPVLHPAQAARHLRMTYVIHKFKLIKYSLRSCDWVLLFWREARFICAAQPKSGWVASPYHRFTIADLALCATTDYDKTNG